MALRLQKLLTTKLTLKISAGILGVFFWSLVHQNHTSTITCSVPVYIYNTKDDQKIIAPDTLTVTLAGDCARIRSLDRTQLAAHINAKKVIAHKAYNLTSDDLLLPKGINVLHYIPSNISIIIETNSPSL